MDLDLERFHQLGNTLLVVRQEEDYRERKTLGFHLSARFPFSIVPNESSFAK